MLIANIVIYIAFAIAVIFIMATVTNKKINSLQQSTDTEEQGIISVKPYKLALPDIIMLVVLVIASAVCGGFVYNNAVSVIAMIKIGVSYFVILAAAIIDLKLRIIPNYLSIILLGARVLIFVYEIIFTDTALSYLVSSLIGCFLCFVILMIAGKISKGGIGGGDIKLLVSLGFMCGIYVVFSSLLLALLCCSVISVILILFKNKNTKASLPFGPFIYAGYAVMCMMSLY